MTLLIDHFRAILAIESSCQNIKFQKHQHILKLYLENSLAYQSFVILVINARKCLCTEMPVLVCKSIGCFKMLVVRDLRECKKWSWMGATTFSPTTFSIATLSIMYSIAAHNIKSTQHTHWVSFCWVTIFWTSDFLIVMLNVVMLSVVLASVAAPLNGCVVIASKVTTHLENGQSCWEATLPPSKINPCPSGIKKKCVQVRNEREREREMVKKRESEGEKEMGIERERERERDG